MQCGISKKKVLTRVLTRTKINLEESSLSKKITAEKLSTGRAFNMKLLIFNKSFPLCTGLAHILFYLFKLFSLHISYDIEINALSNPPFFYLVGYPLCPHSHRHTHVRQAKRNFGTFLKIIRKMRRTFRILDFSIWSKTPRAVSRYWRRWTPPTLRFLPPTLSKFRLP